MKFMGVELKATESRKTTGLPKDLATQCYGSSEITQISVVAGKRNGRVETMVKPRVIISNRVELGTSRYRWVSE